MKTFPLVGCILALVLPAQAVRAASSANDVASNYAGLNTYLNVNRGTGWSNAFTSSSGSPNAFLASAGQIDTSALSFGLSGGGITRNFAGVLSADQFFQFRLQPGSVPAGGSYGLTIANSFSVSSAINLAYSTSSPNYVLNIDNFNPANPTHQAIDTGVPFSTNSLTVAFAQSGGSFTLSLTPAGGSTTALTNTFTGAASGILLYAGGGATMYFNNVAVVPEPASWTTLACGSAAGIGWLLAQRRARGKKGANPAGAC